MRAAAIAPTDSLLQQPSSEIGDAHFEFANHEAVAKLDALTLESIVAGVPPTTAGKEKTARGWFDAFARAVGVKEIYTDRGQSSRAVWFNTTLVLFFIRWCVPRMNGGRGGLPSTAMSYVYGIAGWLAREKRFILHYSTKRVKGLVKGLTKQATERCGPRKKNRKAPITPRQLEFFRKIVLEGGLTDRWKIMLCMLSVAVCGMFRRSEYSQKDSHFNPNVQLTRSDISWFEANGAPVELTESLLQNTIRPPDGWYCELKPPPCKNDFDGGKWHHDPLIFEVLGEQGGIGYASMLCAGNYLWGLEREFVCLGRKRTATALFVDPTTGAPFKTGPYDNAVKGLAAEAYARDSTLPDPAQFGLQGARAGGALALRAAGAPREVIMAMGRWSSDAWMIYIRDRRPETLQWGKRMRQVSELAVANVPLIEQQRPLENWFDTVPIDEVIGRNLDSTRISEDLARLAEQDVLLSANAQTDLTEEREQLAKELSSLFDFSLDDDMDDDDHPKVHYGLEAMARLMRQEDEVVLPASQRRRTT